MTLHVTLDLSKVVYNVFIISFKTLILVGIKLCKNLSVLILGILFEFPIKE
jgi:hypothetical protein